MIKSGFKSRVGYIAACTVNKRGAVKILTYNVLFEYIT